MCFNFKKSLWKFRFVTKLILLNAIIYNEKRCDKSFDYILLIVLEWLGFTGDISWYLEVFLFNMGDLLSGVSGIKTLLITLFVAVISKPEKLKMCCFKQKHFIFDWKYTFLTGFILEFSAPSIFPDKMRFDIFLRQIFYWRKDREASDIFLKGYPVKYFTKSNHKK